MTVPREQVLDALFTLVGSVTFAAPIGPAAATNWVTTSRRLKLWGDVASEQQPAMFMTDHDEEYTQPARGLPPRRFLPVQLWCYARTDGDLVGSTILNTMLTALEEILTPDDRTANVQVLGGLVYRCWIEGRVVKDPGDLDNQALMIVPLRILWP